eukprot:COSAG01_NODE_8131_length_2910_cov_25.758391_1_plen_186_part_00
MSGHPGRVQALQGAKERKKEGHRPPGLVRESNPGPLAPKARIIPLDQRAETQLWGADYGYRYAVPVMLWTRTEATRPRRTAAPWREWRRRCASPACRPPPPAPTARTSRGRAVGRAVRARCTSRSRRRGRATSCARAAAARHWLLRHAASAAAAAARRTRLPTDGFPHAPAHAPAHAPGRHSSPR